MKGSSTEPWGQDKCHQSQQKNQAPRRTAGRGRPAPLVWLVETGIPILGVHAGRNRYFRDDIGTPVWSGHDTGPRLADLPHGTDLLRDALPAPLSPGGQGLTIVNGLAVTKGALRDAIVKAGQIADRLVQLVDGAELTVGPTID